MIARWTIKGLVQARARSSGSVLAVGTALLLVVTFRAVWEGETAQLAAYIENTGVDVWVMQEHVSNMHMATSFISEGKRIEIAAVEGVESLSGILYLNTMVDAGGRQWFAYVVGIDEAGQLGAPWSMASGSDVLAPGEAIIPETLSDLTGSGIGDQIQISDRLFTVVGLSRGTFSVTNPIIFVHARDLADLLSLAGYDSYVLVRSIPGMNPEELSERIEEEVDGVAAMPTAEFVESDIQLASQMGTEVIALMTAICALLAMLLVAFSLYIHTSRSRRELAILKALGFENRHVYGSVLIQAVALTGSAFGLAVLAGGLIAVAGPRLFPVLSLKISITSLLEIGMAGLAIAVIATLTVAWRIARVDPLSVFSQ